MQVPGSNLARGAVVALSTMLPVAEVFSQDKNNQVQAVNQKEEGKPQTVRKAHEPIYINSKDSSSKIQIQPGSALIVQTRSFATLPNYLEGTLKVRLEGDRCLHHFTPEEGGLFWEAVKNPRAEGMVPSALFLARTSGLTKLTVSFYDKKGTEREKTTYNIEVTGKK